MAKKSGKSVSPLVTGKKLPFAAPVPFMTMLLEPNFGKDVTINMVPLTTAYGLSVLADVDKLYIHPVDTFPFKTDMKLTRRYKILNGTSQFVMAAGEFIDFGSKYVISVENCFVHYQKFCTMGFCFQLLARNAEKILHLLFYDRRGPGVYIGKAAASMLLL